MADNRIGMKTKTFIVPGGAVGAPGVTPIFIGGTSLLCRSRSGNAGDLTIRIGNEGNSSLDAGDFYNVGKHNPFTSFVLENTNAGAITVQITIGQGDIRMSNAVNVTNSINISKGATVNTYADPTSAGAGLTVIVGVNNARRQISIVADEGNAGVIRVGDSGNTAVGRGAKLLPGGSVTWDNNTGALSFYSPGAGYKVSVTELAD